MKRSEMVQAMWSFIQSVECDYDYYMDFKDAEELLSKIELLGMIPPRPKDREGDLDRNPRGYDWEPEND